LNAAIAEDWNGMFHFQDSPDEIRRLAASLQGRVVVDIELIARECMLAQKWVMLFT
jgi:hypothetical protein